MEKVDHIQKAFKETGNQNNENQLLEVDDFIVVV
jgi:hypothetical protein